MCHLIQNCPSAQPVLPAGQSWCPDVTAIVMLFRCRLSCQFIFTQINSLIRHSTSRCHGPYTVCNTPTMSPLILPPYNSCPACVPCCSQAPTPSCSVRWLQPPPDTMLRDPPLASSADSLQPQQPGKCPERSRRSYSSLSCFLYALPPRA